MSDEQPLNLSLKRKPEGVNTESFLPSLKMRKISSHEPLKMNGYTSTTTIITDESIDHIQLPKSWNTKTNTNFTTEDSVISWPDNDYSDETEQHQQTEKRNSYRKAYKQAYTKAYRHVLAKTGDKEQAMTAGQKASSLIVYYQR
ncbi:hypothetical protein [Endozoicomonas ascidiicola]|uniref:hypothetical protein n=1 Tax=Endozoicomonas ascidiicola TaxID=1698521 RepID=UPI00082B8413|nr:hypothetical protein [Endozoicomonas ascidiicola]